jgi:hypothetical protein
MNILRTIHHYRLETLGTSCSNLEKSIADRSSETTDSAQEELYPQTKSYMYIK